MEEHWTNHGAKYRLLVHLVWCPKYRRPVLVGGVPSRLKEIARQVCSEQGWQLQNIEVMPDHVHCLVAYDPYTSPSRVAGMIKGTSSRLLRQEFRDLKSKLPTLWSRSYYASSVGMDERMIAEYIDTQWERPWRKDA